MKSYKVEFRHTRETGIWLVVWVTARNPQEAVHMARNRIKLLMGDVHLWSDGRPKQQL